MNPAAATVQTAKAIIEAERIYDHKAAAANAKQDTAELGKDAPITEILSS